MQKKPSFRLIKTLKMRIFILAFLAGLVPLLIITPVVLSIHRSVIINSDTQDLMACAQLFNKEIAAGNFLSDFRGSTSIDEELTAAAEIYHGRILVVNSSLRVVFDSYGVDTGKIIVWEYVIRSAKGESLSFYDKYVSFLTVTQPIKNSDGENVGVILINKSMDYLEQNTEAILSYMMLAILAVVILSAVVALYWSREFTRPLRRAQRGFENVVLEYTSLVPAFKSYAELDNIIDNANKALTKLHSIDESRQEFVSNVSHELKTPLTSMKVLADSLGGADVPIEMYQEFMEDITAEIDRETSIVNDLLALVRMDKKDAKLNISVVDMDEIIELVLKRLTPIAKENNIELTFESMRQVTCEIDEVKMVQVITNLVENAIKYNNPGGYVKVVLDSDHQYCYVTVADNGMGIDEESLEHIFERFYRADKSHSRTINGSGLGLAITKSAIVMHRGDIKVKSTLGEGTTFTVSFPMKYINPISDKEVQ